MKNQVKRNYNVQNKRNIGKILELARKNSEINELSLRKEDLKELEIPQLEKIIEDLKFFSTNYTELEKFEEYLNSNKEAKYLLRNWKYQDIYDFDDLIDFLEEELENKINFYHW